MARRPLTPGAVALDISKILNANALHPNAITKSVIIHTVNDDINITELIAIEVSRDYANNISDYILVTFTMVMGLWIKKIVPNYDNLEMTIVTTYYDKRYVDRYKAVVISGPSSVGGSIYSSYDEETLNRMDKLVLEVQCVNRLVEGLRLLPVAGIYKYATVKDVIKTVLANNVKDVKVESTVVDVNIDVVAPNNEKNYRHINIPMGIRVLDLPTYLQNTDYGVYSADIGTYIQRYGYFIKGQEPKDTVFVYPLYNSELVDKPGKKLMILSSPTITLDTIENSYIEDGDILKIIGSGSMGSDEVYQHKLMDVGNAIMDTNTNSVMETSASNTDTTVTTSNKTNLTGKTLSTKSDGQVGANYTKPTSNPYLGYSEIAKNLLSPHQITWHFANPELLYPGMPVMYVYDDIVKGVVRLNGVLHSTFSKYSGSSKTISVLINVLLESHVTGKSGGKSTVDVRR